jgi:hypothetical protein
MAKTKTLRTCSKGHQYYKTTDCPTCPLCEAEKKPAGGFLSMLSAPARRAMENHGILSLKELSKHTEKDVLRFHGIGKASLPALKKALSEEGLSFKTDA